ncbi:hypothetical protein DLJ46_23295 [Micromonospora globispora]|uniref:DUF3592 domain-containing protein n=1 Tax=Micromonospora globispora TaxID=1450148 RepID=A0A317JZH4_9ACTN|nr:hypothetical protein [Micromonospora globispora]PWU44972.1 hypothetical protein DLJ46_23295 [Micromonospora globispora]
MPGLIAALASLIALPDWVPLAAVVVAALVVSQLVWTRGMWRAASFAVKTLTVATFLASTFWMMAMTQAPRTTVLALRGKPVVATIVKHDITHYPGRSGGYDEHCYRLERTDSTPVFGRICRDSDEFTVGDRITLLVDPSGLIAPETPDEVAYARSWQIMGLVSLVATLALCWISGGLTPLAGGE